MRTKIERLVELEERLATCEIALEATSANDKVVALIPNRPDLYHRLVENLEVAITSSDDIAVSVGNATCALIARVITTPLEGRENWTIEIETRTQGLSVAATGGKETLECWLTNASPGGLEPPFTA